MIKKRSRWDDIIRTVLTLPKHEDLEVMKWSVPHPLTVGFRTAKGDLAGQIADYRLTLSDGRGIHVREYDDHYRIHWDGKDPKVDPIGHLIEDAPHWLAIGIGAILGVLGTYLWKRSREEKEKEEM